MSKTSINSAPRGLRAVQSSPRLAVVGFALALFATAGVHATVLIPADVGELARDARAIVRGRVAGVEGRWTDDRRTIETIVTLEPEAYLKGSHGETVQFRVPGGTYGRYRNIVVGAPQFAVGQRVIVFLGARAPSVPYILGLNQGVFRVVQASNGQMMVTPPATMPMPIGPVVRGASSRQPAPLAVFERDVRALAAGAR
jgi:hypothetical protein